MECALPRFKKQSYVFRRPWYLRLKILDQEVAAEIVLANGHRIETHVRPSFVMTLTLYPSSLQANNASYLIFGCVTWCDELCCNFVLRALSHLFTLLLTESIVFDSSRGGERGLSWCRDDIWSEDRVMHATDSSIRLSQNFTTMQRQSKCTITLSSFVPHRPKLICT